jgi:hypothetical protein
VSCQRFDGPCRPPRQEPSRHLADDAVCAPVHAGEMSVCILEGEQDLSLNRRRAGGELGLRELEAHGQRDPGAVAGEVAECLEFAEDGEIGGRAQRVFQRGQVGDRVAMQVGAEALGLEMRWGA